MKRTAEKHFGSEWQSSNLDPNAPYPWENDPLDTFTLSAPPDAPPTLLPYVLRPHLFNKTVKSLKNGKRPGSDGIMNELFRIMPDPFKESLRYLFILMWIFLVFLEVWGVFKSCRTHENMLWLRSEQLLVRPKRFKNFCGIKVTARSVFIVVVHF